MEHPTQETLQKFLLGQTTRTENRTIVRHLLARCPPCAAILETLWKIPGPPIPPEAYDPALDRFEQELRKLMPQQESPLSRAGVSAGGRGG